MWYLNFKENAIVENYLYMIPIVFAFFVLRHILIFYYKKSIEEQPHKVQMIIEHNLHHDISYTQKSCSSSSSNSSLNTPLLVNKNISINTEFHDIFTYFSDDSEDLILQRRQSLGSKEGASANTPMLPVVFVKELEEKRQYQKQYKHEIHQKIRWFKLLFQVEKILKW